jgi:hypothetical protein
MADEEEIIEEENEDEEIRRSSALLSPEALIILPVAAFLDLIGLVLTIIWILSAFGVFTLEIPEIVNWISDGIGILFFGLWLLVRSAVSMDSTEPTEMAESAVKHRLDIRRGKKEFLSKTAAPLEEELSKETGEVAAKSAGKETGKVATTGAKTAGRGGLKFGVAILGEILPIIGAVPFWTIFVYSELKK